VNFFRYDGKMPFHEAKLRVWMQAIVDRPNVLSFHSAVENYGGGGEQFLITVIPPRKERLFYE
jgi:DNA-nicking Smr family endonuclease